jgi:Phytanoyl-CoA dioxygenase (PhyH)
VAQNTKKPVEQTIAHFRECGWMRVPHAFGSEAAAAMRDAVWDALAAIGIYRGRPSTWTVKRPVRLQHLKVDPVFRAVGSKILFAAIDAVLEGRTYKAPGDWGAFFIAFPSNAEWGIATSGWHLDANYMSPLWPMGGVKTHALFSDIVPRGGGTQIVSGSHRLVHKWFKEHPPPSSARGAELRKLLQSNPYIRDLHTEGDPDARIARFMEHAEEVDGVPLQVVENTGEAGDVILLHPLVLHVAAPNNSVDPRFMLSGGVTTDMWGFGA